LLPKSGVHIYNVSKYIPETKVAKVPLLDFGAGTQKSNIENLMQQEILIDEH
jgi:hypothetical protein